MRFAQSLIVKTYSRVRACDVIAADASDTQYYNVLFMFGGFNDVNISRIFCILYVMRGGVKQIFCVTDRRAVEIMRVKLPGRDDAVVVFRELSSK